MKIGDKIVCEDGIKFEIKKELKSGGQGNIYVAMKNSNPNDLYALKIINEKNDKKKQKKINNIRELHEDTQRFFSLLKNKPFNIALPLSIYSKDKDFGYIMNFYPGKDIGDFMIEKRFDSMPLEDRLTIVYKISESAHFLRTNGYCYQDFSHGNFMYDENKKVISIIDVDNVTASSFSAAGKTNFVKGTMFYIAPEVAFGQCNPSIDSDNYALATLFFKIMTGSTNSPYHGKVLYSKPVMPGSMDDAAYYAQDDPEDFGVDWLTFVFDPVDTSNEIELNDPDPNFVAEGKKVINNWKAVPEEMKQLFYRAFKDPLDEEARKKRPSSSDWMRIIDGLLSNSTKPSHQPITQINKPTNVKPVVSKLKIYVELPNHTKVSIDSEQIIKTSRGSKLGIIKPEGNKFKFVSQTFLKIRIKLGAEYKDLYTGEEIELKEGMEVYIITNYNEKLKVLSIK